MPFFNSSRSATTGGGAAQQKVERTLGVIGWSIDQRLDDGVLGLNFKDPVVGVRTVLLAVTESFLTVFVESAAELWPASIPEYVFAGFLHRNNDGVFNSWKLIERDSGKAGFRNSYTALVDGINAPLLKHIIESILREVQTVDSGLKSKGLI